MGDFAIREARPDEHAAVGRLTVDAYSEYEPKLSPTWWRHYRRDLSNVAERARTGVILVAEVDGELAGAVTYNPAGSGRGDVHEFPADWAYFRALAVDPGHRGQGIGRALADECVRRARAEGAAALALHTTFLMPVARAMYERMGFEQLDEHDDWPEGLYWTYVLRFGAAA